MHPDPTSISLFKYHADKQPIGKGPPSDIRFPKGKDRGCAEGGLANSRSPQLIEREEALILQHSLNGIVQKMRSSEVLRTGESLLICCVYIAHCQS